MKQSVAFRFQNNANPAIVGGSFAGGTIAAASVSITAYAPPILHEDVQIWLEPTAETGFIWRDDPAVSLYFPQHHELTYIWWPEMWNGSTWVKDQLPASTVEENLLTGWNDQNIAYGHCVSFRLKAGRWRFRLWCIHHMDGAATKGRTATATSDEYIVDTIEDTFAEADRIYFDKNAVWSGVPAASTKVSDRDGLQSAHNGATTNPTCILFPRGQTIDEWDALWSTKNDRVNMFNKVIYIGAYGTGTRPHFNIWSDRDAFRLDTGFSEGQFCVADVTMNCGYDPINETALSPQRASSSNKILRHDRPTTEGLMIMYSNVEVYGDYYRNPDMSVSITTRSFLMHTECKWEGSGDFVIHASAPTLHYTYVGGTIACDEDDMQGWEPKNDSIGGNLHNGVRIYGEKLYFAMSNFFARHGWGDSAAESSPQEEQPCIRLYNDGEDIWANIERVTMEGAIVWDIINNPGNEAKPGSSVIDKMILLQSCNGNSADISCRSGGTTFRNILMVEPDRPMYDNADRQTAFVMENDFNDPVAGNLDAPCWIYDNTFCSVKAAANAPTGFGQLMLNRVANGQLTVTEENNVVHCPNDGSGFTSFAPIDTTTAIAGFNPKHKGMRVNYWPIVGTLGSSVAPGQSFTVPYSAITKQTGIDQTGAAANPTDQTYWDTHLAAGAGGHRLRIGGAGGAGTVYAHDSISVTNDATGLVVQNDSANTWNSGERYVFRPARPNDLPGFNPDSVDRSNVGKLIPLPRPQTGSSAINDNGGIRAYDDIFGNVRPNPDFATDHLGNAIPNSGSAIGALLPA